MIRGNKMKITKEQLFKKALEVLGHDTEVVETKYTFVSGQYKYYKKSRII